MEERAAALRALLCQQPYPVRPRWPGAAALPISTRGNGINGRKRSFRLSEKVTPFGNHLRNPRHVPNGSSCCFGV